LQKLSGQRSKDELQQLRKRVSELEVKEKQLQILNVNLSREYQKKIAALEKKYQDQILKEQALLSPENGKPDSAPPEPDATTQSIDLSALTSEEVEQVYLEARARCKSNTFQDILLEITHILDKRKKEDAH